MVSEISVVNGTKYITLKTIIDIKNHYIKPVNIWSKSSKMDYKILGCIEPDQTFNVPVDVVYSESCDFFFQIKGEDESVSYESYNWRELMDTPVYSKHLCKEKFLPIITNFIQFDEYFTLKSSE